MLKTEEEVENTVNDEDDEFKINQILSHTWDSRKLFFNVQLTSGRDLDIPFNLLKKIDQSRLLDTSLTK